jgi:hypothetical protein
VAYLLLARSNSNEVRGYHSSSQIRDNQCSLYSVHHDCILRGPSLPLAIHLIFSAISTFTFSFFVTLRRHRNFPTWLSYRKIAVQQSLLVLFYLTQLNASLHFRYLTDQHGVGTFYRLQTTLVQALTKDRVNSGL